MYAIVSVGGMQFWVDEGMRVDVPRREGEAGSTLSISEVLFVGGSEKVRVGQPYVEGAQVTAKIESHVKGPKVVSFRYRRRKGSKKTIGHRQPLTRLVIEKIES
ncbi:50S ribosomal protein L21 [bacterium]|nr:50S ribosomal protein L21 [bacterium]